MILDNKMIDTLQEKPIIGIMGGFGGWVLGNVKNYMTDDNVLSGIAIIGAWIGVLIAAITLIIKLVEFCKLVNTWTMQLKQRIKELRKK